MRISFVLDPIHLVSSQFAPTDKQHHQRCCMVPHTYRRSGRVLTAHHMIDPQPTDAECVARCLSSLGLSRGQEMSIAIAMLYRRGDGF
jgi:hypothetical protein